MKHTTGGSFLVVKNHGLVLLSPRVSYIDMYIYIQ